MQRAAFKPDPEPEPHIKRARLINLPASWLDQVPARAELDLELFPQVRLKAVFDRVRVNDGRWVAVGRVEGVPGSEVIVASREGVMSAAILWPGQGQFEIRYHGDGQHRISELDPNRLPGCGNKQPLIPPLGAASVTSGSEAGAATTTTSGDVGAAGTTLDVLVVYTAQAVTGAGGLAALNTVIDLAVEQTNLSYANSFVDGAINVVHREQVTYTESGSMQTDLERVTDKTDGFMDNVHALRDDYGADLVALITENSSDGFAGIAYIMCNVGPSFEEFAFSVTRQQFAPNHTFAHEIGHNLGSHHDHDNAGSCQAYDYSFGHRFTATDGVEYRTVMAYAPGVRISYFSNPNVDYIGTPTGVAGTGPTAADNAQSINNTMPVAAAFRASVAPPGGPNPPTNLTAVPVSELRIDLAWVDNADDETAFEIERSPNGVSGWGLIATTTANATSYANTGLTADTTYYYRVRATNPNGDSDYSNVASATTLEPRDNQPPSIPAWVVVNPQSTTALKVTWQRATDTGSGVAGYRLYRGKKLVVDTPALTHTVGGLTPEATACFSVVAYDAEDNQSPPSVEGCGATLPEIPSPPSDVAAILVSSSRSFVSWTDNATNERGFEIERSLSMSGPWSHFASTGPNGTSVLDYGLGSGLDYHYRVRAFNQSGLSPYSNLASVTTDLSLDTTPPSVPGGAWLDHAGDDMVLRWDPSTDNATAVAGYRIYRDGKFHAATTTHEYRLMGLPEQREFCLTVTAFDVAGNESAASNPACGAGPIYDSLEGTWSLSIKGPQRGLAYVTFAADGTARGYGYWAASCSPFELSGTWSRISTVEARFDYQLLPQGCTADGLIEGVALAKIKRGTAFKARATDGRGASKWNGLRVTHYPSAAGDWVGQSRAAGYQLDEFLSITPTAQGGVFEVSAVEDLAGYELSGWMMVTPSNELVAWLRRRLGLAPVESFYSGKIDLVGGALKAKGYSSSGAADKLQAERR